MTVTVGTQDATALSCATSSERDTFARSGKASGESARETLAKLTETRISCQAQIARMEQKSEDATKTLADIRSTLARWDDMKARWGEVFDGFAEKIAASLEEKNVKGPDGSLPTGALAHGFEHANDGLADPKRVVECSELARPKMSGANIPAHEYHDSPSVLKAKVKVLASMLRRSRHCALYTGAGISTAAGINDYASKAGARSSVLPKNLSNGTPFDAGSALSAGPTFAHRALVALHRHGMVEGGWVQQNHDGLPQKAGLPQEAINEIHGGWFDPSNPVVPMSGSLRRDLVSRLNDTKKRADLVVAMGTSLSGVSADGIVSHIGYARLKAVQPAPAPKPTLLREPLSGVAEASQAVKAPTKQEPVVINTEPIVLGAVIINIQQTRLDGYAALRIFATCDEVMSLLAIELGLKVPSTTAPKASRTPYLWTGLPYDAQSGARMAEGASSSSLDLSIGRRIQLAEGNAPMAPIGTKGRVSARSSDGHYTLVCDDGVTRHLGAWMLEAAQQGQLDVLPVVAAQDSQ